jgi:hypothetical protein
VTAERLKKWATVGWSRTLEGLACAGGEDPYGDATFRAACRLGSLVHLVGTTDQAVEELVDVAVGLGLSEREARSNAERGVRKGGEDGPPKDLPTELLSFIGSPDGARSTQTRPQPARATKPEKPKRMTPEDLEAVEAASVPLGESEAGLIWARKRLGDAAADRLVGSCDEVRVLKKGERLPSCFRGPVGRAGVVLFPTYDAEGLAGWRARPIEPSGPKALAPSGCAVEGHVLADAGGRALLRGDLDKPDPLVVVVVEGETDYLAWCSQDHKRFGIDAVLGVVNRAWTPELGQRIPAGATVHLRTDLDEPGDGYAAAVAATLPPSVTVLRKRPIRGPAAAGAEEAGAVLDDEADLLLAGSEVLEASWKASTPYGEEAGEQGRRADEDSTTGDPHPESGGAFVTSVSRFPGAGDSVSPGIDWPEPALLGNELEPMPAELLPPGWRDYAVETAAQSRTPLEMAAGSTMTAFSGVVQRIVATQPEPDSPHVEHPGQWGAMVASAGSRKTSVANRAFSLLQGVEREAAEENAEKLKRYARQLELHKLKRKRIDISTPEGESEMLALEEPEEPKQTRFIVQDVTYEALAEVMRRDPRGVLVARDELAGMFAGMKRTDQAPQRSFWLECWSGSNPFRFDRIGRGSQLIPCVRAAVWGNIQPGVFGEFLDDCRRGANQDGLLERFGLLFYPNRLRPSELASLREQQRSQGQSDRAFLRAEGLVRWLLALDPTDVGATMMDHPSGPLGILRFDPEALPLYRQWAADLEDHCAMLEDGDPLLPFKAKWPKVAIGVATVWHLTCGNPGKHGISVEAWQAALGWLRIVEQHLRRVLRLGEKGQVPPAELLGRKILGGALPASFTLRELERKNWAGLTTKRARRVAVEDLEGGDWLRRELVSTGGRPSLVFHVNPRLTRGHLVGWGDDDDDLEVGGPFYAELSTPPNPLTKVTKAPGREGEADAA